jgi:hypothetical protein
MGKPSAPAAPDYQGAAQAQGAANIQAARTTAKLNNPNVSSPYGTQSVSYGTFDQPGFDTAMQQYQQALAAYNAPQPAAQSGRFVENFSGDGRTRPTSASIGQMSRGAAPIAPTQAQFTRNEDTPTFTQTFSPEQQALYNQQAGNQLLLGGLGTQGINAAQGIVGRQVDYSGASAMPGSSDAIRRQVYDAMMQRPNEDIAVQRDNANSQLTAAGIPKDSLAYQNAMRQIDRQENDARNQAVISGGVEAQRNYGMDIQSRQQGLNEYNAQRSIPLNEITALMSGSQVSNPFQMPSYAQSSQIAPAPTYAATNAQGQYSTDVFNQKSAQQGNMQSGLLGLGGTALMVGAMF